MTRCILLLFTSALTFASTFAAPVPKAADKPEFYFPTQKGTRLCYETADGDAMPDEIVMATERKAEAWEVTMGHEVDGKSTPYEKYLVSEKGVCGAAAWVNGKLTAFEEPRWWFKSNARRGDKWDLTAVADPSGELAGSAMFEGSERLTVPAGTFETVRLKYRLKGSIDTFRMTLWLAPKVGKVKMKLDGQAAVLKSFTVGKD